MSVPLPSTKATEVPERCAAVRRKIVNPLQIDRSKDHAADRAAILDDWIGCDQCGYLADPCHEIVAKRKIPRMQRVLKIGAVRNIQADNTRVGRTFYSAICAGNVYTVKPRDFAGQFGECPIAVGWIERHFGVDPRDDLEQSAHGVNDLALGFGAAACQIGHSGESEFDAFGTGSFETAKTFEHEGGDRQKSNNDQAGADTKSRLAAQRRVAPIVPGVAEPGRLEPRRLGPIPLEPRPAEPRPVGPSLVGPRGLETLCLNFRHVHSPPLGFPQRNRNA